MTMNLKRIDFVANSYEKADDDTRARIALFRPVWEAQASAEAYAGARLAASGWETPAAEELAARYHAGTPLLDDAPVSVDAPTLAAVARAVEAALDGEEQDEGEEGAADTQARAEGSVDWDALVAATPVELAGRNPGAYLDASVEAAVAACGEEGAGRALLVLSLALKTQLAPAAERLMTAVRPLVEAEGAANKPLSCPVCGSEAALAHVGPTAASKANVRTLWCAQCGTSWNFERIRCARCGTQSQTKLHYTSIEGDEAHRIHRCDECHGYIRTHFALTDDMAPFAPEVEDVVMANLDAVAAEMGLGPTVQAE